MKASLDKRLALAMYGVATLVMVLFALVLSYASERIEHGVLDQLVIRESGDIQMDLAAGHSEPLHDTAQLRSWLTKERDDPALPEPLRRLPDGVHHEVFVGRSAYHVLREPTGSHGFLTLAYEIDLVEEKEQQFHMVLLALVLLGPIFIMLLGYSLFRPLTGPVMKLAEKLRTLDPAQRGVQLGKEFGGQEVGAIADAFDRYQERLDLLVERERSFSAAASHELRTPLASVAASLELLQEMRGLPEGAAKHVGRMSAAIGNMTEVVNSLLALARDSAPAAPRPFHAHQVIEEAVANYRGQLHGKDVALDFQCDEELVLWMPVGEFVIILGNLLQNAVRNTERGSILLACTRDTLSVSDTGRGMPAEFAAHIFDKHIQAHDSHGAGLGLHIVKRLCDRHGWGVQVTSSVGQGTTIRVNWSSRGA